MEQKGLEYISKFAQKISTELKEDYKNGKDFTVLKAVEDLTTLMENNGLGTSYNSKVLFRNYENKKIREDIFLNNIRLFKKVNREEFDVFPSEKGNTAMHKNKHKTKDIHTLKNPDQLRQMAFKDLNLKLTE